MAKRRKRKAGQMYDPNELLKKPTLRIEEAADLSGYHPDTIRRWGESGKLQVVISAGGHRRVRTESLRKYL